MDGARAGWWACGVCVEPECFAYLHIQKTEKNGGKVAIAPIKWEVGSKKTPGLKRYKRMGHS